MTNVLEIPGGWAGMELIEPLLQVRSDVHNHFVIISGEKSCSFQAFCLQLTTKMNQRIYLKSGKTESKFKVRIPAYCK